MMTILVVGHTVENELCEFVINEGSIEKYITRKVNYNSHDGLYINYKGKKYFEYEWSYLLDAED